MKYIKCPNSSEKIELFPKSEGNDYFTGFKYETVAEFPYIPAIGNKNKEHETSREYDSLSDKIIKG